VIVQGIGTEASQMPGSFISAYDGKGHLLCASHCTNTVISNGTGPSGGGGDGSGDDGEARRGILGIFAACSAVVFPLSAVIFGVHIFARKSPAFRSQLAKVLPEVCLPSLAFQNGNDNDSDEGNSASLPGKCGRAVSKPTAPSVRLWQQSSKSRSHQKAVLSAFAFAESNVTAVAAAPVELDQQSWGVATYASRRLSSTSAATARQYKQGRHPEVAQDDEEGRIRHQGATMPSPVPFWMAKDQLPEMLTVHTGAGVADRVRSRDKFSDMLHSAKDYTISNMVPRPNEVYNSEMPSQPLESTVGMEPSKRQWQQHLLDAARQDAALNKHISLSRCRTTENFSQTTAAITSADQVVLRAATASTAAWRQSEAILFQSNVQGVHAECLWPRIAPAKSRANSISSCSNNQNYSTGLSNGMGSKNFANGAGQPHSKCRVGSVPVFASGGARLVEAGLPPMAHWDDEVVAGAAAVRVESSAVHNSQHASASIVSRSVAPAIAAGTMIQSGMEVSPRDSAKKLQFANNLAQIGGFSRDLRTPLEDLRASGIRVHVSGSSNSSIGTNGILQPPAFRETLHRHHAASAITSGSRRRQGNATSPPTSALVGQVLTSPRSSVLF
jgi:hypothetical protein